MHPSLSPPARLTNRAMIGLIIMISASLSCNALISDPVVDQASTPSSVSELAVPTDRPEEPDVVITQQGKKASTPEIEQPTQIQPPGVLLEDDFEDPDSGWEIGNYDSGSVGYENGSYFVESSLEGNLMWGTAGMVFENTDITVETRQISAPPNDNNGYGIMCRIESGEDGYTLRISGDGYAAIQYFKDGEMIQLVEWFETPLIRKGNTTNVLRAVCDGPNLALYINGELAAEATDSTFIRGDIALAATSYEPEPTKILFDNIRVMLPQR